MAGYFTDSPRTEPLLLHLTTRLHVEIEEIVMEAETGTFLKMATLGLRNATRMRHAINKCSLLVFLEH